MGKLYDGIDSRLSDWIAGQHMFFVATAPLDAGGHVNASPKGGDSFRILSPTEVAYQDYTGSGAETIAHLRENGRIVIMFCAFDGPPRILRLYGHGAVLTPGSPDYTALARRFPEKPGIRGIVRVTVTRIADSCGYGVPRYDFKSERNGLERWAAGKGADGLAIYRRENNRTSIDGMPALDDES